MFFFQQINATATRFTQLFDMPVDSRNVGIRVVSELSDEVFCVTFDNRCLAVSTSTAVLTPTIEVSNLTSHLKLVWAQWFQ